MSDDVTVRRRELKGSRLRCLMATSLADRDVAAFLNQMVHPHARVSPSDSWQPRGLLEGDEARLGEAAAFLSAEHREALTGWWLAVRERANTPNWDIVSTCQIDGRQGLVLVEAKAHRGELSTLMVSFPQTRGSSVCRRAAPGSRPSSGLPGFPPSL